MGRGAEASTLAREDGRCTGQNPRPSLRDRTGHPGCSAIRGWGFVLDRVCGLEIREERTAGAAIATWGGGWAKAIAKSKAAGEGDRSTQARQKQSQRQRTGVSALHEPGKSKGKGRGQECTLYTSHGKIHFDPAYFIGAQGSVEGL